MLGLRMGMGMGMGCLRYVGEVRVESSGWMDASGGIEWGVGGCMDALGGLEEKILMV